MTTTPEMPEYIYAWMGLQQNGSWDADKTAACDGVRYIRDDLVTPTADAQEAFVRIVRHLPRYGYFTSGCQSDADIEIIHAALSALVSNKGWMPIESAPRDGTDIIGLNENQGVFRYVCWWNPSHGYFTCTGGDNCQPTHWQPLPTPPQDKKGVMMKSKIITYHAYPPIPERRFDWCAYRDGTEDGGLQGWGKTEADAVSDLIQREGE